LTFGVSWLIQDNPILKRASMDIIKRLESRYSIGMNMGLDLQIYGVYLWKGWAYKDWRMSNSPWAEAFGVGIPVLGNYQIEFTNTNDFYIFSVLGKF